MALVGTKEINNTKVEIHASTMGTWSITLPPDEDGTRKGRDLGTGNSLDAAVNKARQEIKRRQVKVAVPFKTREGKAGVANSFHARSTDKVLAEVGGKKEQFGYRAEVFKHDMPQSVINHLNELEDEARKIQAEQRKIKQEWHFDLSKAVEEAITEKAGKRDA